MATEVKLPSLGDGIESGDILDVLVREGDVINKDQGIVEVETDKASVEVPSPISGRVLKVHVASGQSVKIGGVLLTVEAASGATTPPPPAAPPAKQAAAPPAPQAPSVPPAPKAPPVAVTPPPTPVAPVAATPAPVRATAAPVAVATPVVAAPPTVVVPEPSSVAAAVVAAGPAIRRFAREVGVDLGQVRGSGPSGRITRDDVLEVVRRANQTPVAATAPAPAATTAASADTSPALPGTPSNDAWGPVSIEAASKIRRTIAAKMHESWSTVPRVTNFDDADITELEKIRDASKDDYKARGIRLTAMPFVVKAVSMALRNHPLINASYDMEQGQIIYRQYINVGVAVDTERGLVVPVLRNSDRKSISDIAKEVTVTAERARTNDFSIDDLRGGTFTISNLGAIGGTYSTPIVNVPEVAILLVGRSRKMPVVINDEIAIRLMMPLSLSYDHRLVDGGTAARFLNDVIGFLQAPGRLLLAP